jgi:hypothetical protein
MRKEILMIVITLVSYITQAQTEFTNYSIDGTKYSNLITDTGSEKGYIYLSLGVNNDVMVILRDLSERKAFHDFIELTYGKYRNMKYKAVNNNLRQHVAVIKGFDQNGGFFFKKDSRWKISKRRAPLKALFQVDDGRASYVLVIPKTPALDNKAITCEPQYINIQYREELDNLLISISEDSIEKHFKTKKANSKS